MQSVLWKAGPMVIQLALATLALLVAAFTPPAQGRILLVPVGGQSVSRGSIAEVKATVLARGPLPGSWVVEGERRRLAPLWTKKVLVLAAPQAICSDV